MASQNKKPGRITKRHIFYGASFWGAAITAALASLFSLELSFLIVGFSALTGFVLMDRERREKFERKFNKRLTSFESKHEKLDREVMRNTNDIAALKDGIAETAFSLERQQIELEKSKGGELPAMRKVAQSLKSLGQRPRSSSIKREKPEGPRATKPQNQNPSPIANDAADIDPSAMSDLVIKELLHHAVRQRRIDAFVQPIMRLPQRKVRYYELFARIRAKPGVYLAANQYLHLAEQDKLINDIDQMLLVHCLKIVKDSAHIKNAAPFFLNVSTRTLRDKSFMSKLLAFLAKNRPLAQRLIFEIQQKDFEDMEPAIMEILRGLGELGCAFSLDNVTNLNFDLKFLQVLKVRFIKVNAKLLAQRLSREKDYADFWKVKRKIEGNGIALIVEKIETEEDLRALLDFDPHYGQGYLFGKPDLEGAYRQRLAA